MNDDTKTDDRADDDLRKERSYEREVYEDDRRGGVERIRRQRPHRSPREDDHGRRPNRSGKPLW